MPQPINAEEMQAQVERRRNAAGQCGWCGKRLPEAERNYNGDHSLFICDRCFDEEAANGVA